MVRLTIACSRKTSRGSSRVRAPADARGRVSSFSAVFQRPRPAAAPMSEWRHTFEAPAGRVAVFLPFPLHDLIAGWSGLRAPMIRERSPAFTRDEWAYLLEFLDPGNLLRPFGVAFGDEVEREGGAVRHLARLRGQVAVWLPGNVSLLGPLTLILLSLT